MKQSWRWIYGGGFIWVLFLLLGSIGWQWFQQEVPCLLCVAQRICWVAVGLFLLFGFCFSTLRRLSWIFPAGVFFFSGMGLYFSGRQVWLQHAVTDQTQAMCGVSFNYLFQILPWHDFMEMVLNGTHECAKRGISILGLDLAVWSLLHFLLFFFASLWIMKYLFKRKDGLV